VERKVVLEGYVYEYCHADDCHTFIYPTKLTPERIRELVGPTDEEDEEALREFPKTKQVPWYMYWTALHKVGKSPCIILEKLKGRKVRVTIEVVGEG